MPPNGPLFIDGRLANVQANILGVFLNKYATQRGSEYYYYYYENDRKRKRVRSRA